MQNPGSADPRIAIDLRFFPAQQELRPPEQGVRDGVRVCAINSGSIETDRLRARLALQCKAEGIDEAKARRRNLAKLGVVRYGLPEEIGQAVCFLASATSAGYFNGAIIDVDGGQTRHI